MEFKRIYAKEIGAFELKGIAITPTIVDGNVKSICLSDADGKHLVIETQESYSSLQFRTPQKPKKKVYKLTGTLGNDDAEIKIDETFPTEAAGEKRRAALLESFIGAGNGLDYVKEVEVEVEHE